MRGRGERGFIGDHRPDCHLSPPLRNSPPRPLRNGDRDLPPLKRPAEREALRDRCSGDLTGDRWRSLDLLLGRASSDLERLLGGFAVERGRLRSFDRARRVGGSGVRSRFSGGDFSFDLPRLDGGGERSFDRSRRRGGERSRLGGGGVRSLERSRRLSNLTSGDTGRLYLASLGDSTRVGERRPPPPPRTGVRDLERLRPGSGVLDRPLSRTRGDRERLGGGEGRLGERERTRRRGT